MSDFSVYLEYVALPGGSVYLLPSEEAIEMERWRAEQLQEGNPQQAARHEAYALELAQVREKNLARAEKVTVEMIKPTYGALQNAKLKHSTMNPVTGTASVNPIGLMKELVPQCVASGSILPKDPVLAEIVENRLYETLYPTQERLDFLLSR